MSYQTPEQYLERLDAKFTKIELACRCCGLMTFHPSFLEHLHGLRIAFDKPMSLSSACRCLAHNIREGGAKKSLHIGDTPQHPGQLGTLAVDVRVPDGAYRGALFALAWRLGWSIGWGRGFLHLDRRDWVGLPQQTFDY